jgi:hypothetical protein
MWPYILIKSLYSNKIALFEGKNRFVMIRKDSPNCTLQTNCIKANGTNSKYVTLGVRIFPPA